MQQMHIYRHRQGQGIWPMLLLIVLSLFLAIFTGMVATVANPLIIMLFVALILGLFLMSQPTLLLWLVLVSALVFSGAVVLYYPILGHLRWGVVIAALALGLAAVFVKMFSGREDSRLEHGNHEDRKILAWAFIFVVIVCFSALYNLGFKADALIGLKGYFQVWGILIAFAWIKFNINTARNLGRGLLWLAALQVPFALHQYFVLVPQRLSEAAAREFIVAPDIVVGTFIGSMGGGGGNAILTSLQVISIAFLFALWRQGQIKGGAVFSLTALYMIPVLLNETKVTFVVFPLAMLLIYWDRVLKNPFKFFISVILVAGLLVALFLFYASLPRAQGYKGPVKYWEETMQYNIGKKGYGAYLLNRTTVYEHWLKHHGWGEFKTTLIGHGAGETNEGGIGLRSDSLAMSRYRGLGIGLTGFSALLWEVGILGTVALVGLFYSAFRAAGRLAAHVQESFDRAMLRTLQAGVVVMGFSLLHNNYIVFEIGYQTLLMLLIGLILLYARNVRTATAAT